MTPQEAAGVMFASPVWQSMPRDGEERRALRVLIEHARATAAPEIVTGEEAQGLPVGSAIVDERDVELSVDPCARVRLPGAGHMPASWTGPVPVLVRSYRVLYRNAPAPESTPPIAVGDTVTTAAELDRLPVGAVARTALTKGGRVVENRGAWYAAADPKPIPRDALIGARVLDLGEVTS